PAAIAAMAERLLPRGEAERWNPALMDYGATVCLPRPRCSGCALSPVCAARPRFEAGETAEPVRAQGRWDGSDRQWRGRIMQALRDAHADGGASVSRAALVRRLAGDDATARTRVRGLIDALAADGLAWVRGGRCGLGTAPEA